MNRYYGFDLGDAESAVSRLSKDDKQMPEIIPVRDEKSFITAYALTKSGELLIGESACYAADVSVRKIRFKSSFLTDPSALADVKSFAAGVLGDLYLKAQLIQGEDCAFYIGCPAGWDKAARERYRSIFEEAGFPPAKIISESRAALVSACQSRYLQVGYDILSKPVLVVDIGSSTTDFAYISGGREVELKTAGEVFLGGGIMDEILLELSVEASKDERKIRKIFEEAPAWKTYCEFAARRLKEQYFRDEEYWKNNECLQTVTISYNVLPVRLTLRINEEIADKLLNSRSVRIGNRSFHDVFSESLTNAREHIAEQPQLLFLTGGVSRLPAVKKWCTEVFPEAVVINSKDPEFSVSRGLAWCGRIDEELHSFRQEIDDLKASSTVEQIVEAHMDELYHSLVDALVEPILQSCALPVINKWRNKGIERLSDIDDELQREIEKWLHTEDAKKVLSGPITAWLKPVAYALEEKTQPICVRHNVPYSALSLTSYLSLSDINIKVDAKDVFAVEEITWLIDAIVSVLVGLVCGGSGIALIASGIPGILAGAVVSFLVLALGKNRMQQAILDMNIPGAMRKLIPERYFETRIESIEDEVKKNLYDNLEKERNADITDRLVREISEQIETCLTKMAEVVEIPLDMS